MINVPMLQRVLFLALLAPVAACGGSTGGKVPVDHPVYEHQVPPEVAELEDAEEEDEEELEDETIEADADGVEGAE